MTGLWMLQPGMAEWRVQLEQVLSGACEGPPCQHLPCGGRQKHCLGMIPAAGRRRLGSGSTHVHQGFAASRRQPKSCKRA
jgi:hypothetical protein